MIDLDAVVADTHKMPPLPKTASRLAMLLAGDWSLEDITEALSRDAPLTGRLLGIANSAGMGGMQQITGVGQALMRVGPGTVLALSMSSAAHRALEAGLPCGLDEDALWRHSVAASLTIEVAPRHCGVKLPAASHSAALLHDIGKVVLSRHVSSEDVEFLRRAHDEAGAGVRQAEMELLEAHHGEIGGLIAQHWSLPEPIPEAVTHHHTPSLAPTADGRLVAYAIALSDVVCNRLGLGDGDPIEEPLLVEIDEALALKDGAWDALVEAVGERFDAILSNYD